MQTKDLFGRAILDHFNGHKASLITETSISEAEEFPVDYLFRDYDEMPNIEQKALAISSGRILDVGCGAGSHSLYLQQMGFEVTAIDISESAVKTAHARGVNKVTTADVWSYSGEFDTVLLLMNGTGLCGQLERLPAFLEKLKTLLADGGQILIDSSDIIYLFEEDEDGGLWVPGDRYYGEVDFCMSYRGEEERIDWLYVDFAMLSQQADSVGLKCEKITEGPHYDYLARLTRK